MSVTLVRSYFRTHMNALGWKEHRDGFNYENIPANIFDGVYHIESGDVRSDGVSQGDIELATSISVRLFLKGHRDPAGGIDRGISDGEKIIARMMSAANRLGAGIKNVLFQSMNVRAWHSSNDNALVVTLDFEVKTNLAI